jgi:GH24 family phage-related lysozyme (muramidase)
MPKLFPTKRGKAWIAAALIAAAAGGWNTFTASKLTPAHPDITPAIVRQAVDKGITPPAVLLALELIKKWEGLRTSAYLDIVGVKTVCYGETRINGHPVQLGMTFTPEQCEDMARIRVTRDYFMPLVDKVPEFTKAPVSVQAALTSLAYNVGTGDKNRGAIGSSAAGAIGKFNYPLACDNLLKWNKAGGREIQGLTNRRGMGDPGRAGEGEICVSGL